MEDTYNQWLAQLKTSMTQAPLTPRLPLVWGEHVLGSVEAQGFAALVAQASLGAVVRLQTPTLNARAAWVISGNPGQALQHLAQTMRAVGYAQVAHLWRDEQLAVRGDGGQTVATVERGAVRALGISTHGVHLHGCAPDKQVWIQQRARDKKTHPGRWDTLMGGMVSAADSLEQALARETQEEAGLELAQLHDLRRGGDFTMRLPNATDNGLEYVVERIDWYTCTVPSGVLPINTDGEVQQFRLVDLAMLRQMLAAQAFTPEAGLILVNQFS